MSSVEDLKNIFHPKQFSMKPQETVTICNRRVTLAMTLDRQEDEGSIKMVGLIIQ